MISSLDELVKKAQLLPKKTIAIAQAADEDVLKSADEAYRLGLANFLLIAETDKLESVAKKMGLTWTKDCHIPASNDADAAQTAVRFVQDGKAEAVMKGHLQTGLFLKAVLDKEKGLRGTRLLSQCSVYENPLNNKLLLVTDCAMNIAPDLMQKKQIIENAIELANTLGIAVPKVAILTALETVNPDMPETIDAAVLSKMADRKQIKSCIIDGPFALDNALSKEEAAHKGVVSPVPGELDIILAPDIKTGNAMHKTIIFFTNIKNAAICLGASVPVVMTSRADSVATKVYSIALGAYHAQAH